MFNENSMARPLLDESVRAQGKKKARENLSLLREYVSGYGGMVEEIRAVRTF